MAMILFYSPSGDGGILGTSSSPLDNCNQINKNVGYFCPR